MVFGTFPREGETGFQRALSERMVGLWAGFAKDLMRGSGWGEVPELRYFGGGVTPGNEGVGGDVLRVVDAGVVDGRCGV